MTGQQQASDLAHYPQFFSRCVTPAGERAARREARPLTEPGSFPIVRFMRGPNHICGIRPEIIR
jgi:hypothetical protein